jgi:hypothetical protein
MAKKLSLLLAAVAVAALAVPVTANASSITSSAGKLAPVGTTLTATGTDVNITSAILGSITCSTLTLDVTLDLNSGSTFTATEGPELPAQSGCVTNGRPFLITGVEVTHLVSTTSGTGTSSFILGLEIFTSPKVHCTFTGTKVPFTYVVGSDTIAFSNAAGVSGGPCGTAKLDGTFTIEIGDTSVILD